ncbi:MAG: hypothetical protein QGF59_01600, partial [Pirellulaceae bacterium]|nr:hypothetical protein [Pirellulaceae bacterium]
IQVASTASDVGYGLRALIPLRHLQIELEAKQWLLEIQVNSHNGKMRIYKTLFGSKLAYQNNSRYGVFSVKADAEE